MGQVGHVVGGQGREQDGEGRGLTSTCIFHHQVQRLLRLNHLEELHCNGQGVAVEGLGEKRLLTLHLHSVTAHVLAKTPPLLKNSQWLPTDGKIFPNSLTPPDHRLHLLTRTSAL